MSPDLLQGQRLKQGRTEKEIDDKLSSSTLPDEDNPGEAPVEIHQCQRMNRIETSILPPTGTSKSVSTEAATRLSFDLQKLWLSEKQSASKLTKFFRQSLMKP